MEYNNKKRLIHLLEEGAEIEEKHDEATMTTEILADIYAKTYEDMAETKKDNPDWFAYFLVNNAYSYGLAIGYNLKN